MGTWQKTGLILHLGKANAINLNWPNEYAPRTSDIIIVHEKEKKFKIAWKF